MSTAEKGGGGGLFSGGYGISFLVILILSFRLLKFSSLNFILSVKVLFIVVLQGTL